MFVPQSLRVLRIRVQLRSYAAKICLGLSWIFFAMLFVAEKASSLVPVSSWIFDLLVVLGETPIAVFIALFFYALRAGFIQSRKVAQVRFQQARLRAKAESDPRDFFLLLRTRRGAIHQLEEEEDWSADTPDVYTWTSRDYLAILADALEPHGLLVAIGVSFHPSLWFDGQHQLSENILFIPAEDQGWFAVFKRLALDARAIIIVPENSPGVLSELRHLADSELQRKMLVYMTPAQHAGNRGAAKRERWDEISAQLASEAMRLPPYRSGGTLYIPAKDFSIARSAEGDLGSVEGVRQAVESLLPFLRPGVPLAEALARIDPAGEAPEAERRLTLPSSEHVIPAPRGTGPGESPGGARGARPRCRPGR
jgi:hypothetical protein